MSRTRLLLAAGALIAGASAAHAQSCGGRSIDEIIASCDDAFGGYGLLITSARGWCYLLNSARCAIP